MRMCKCLLRDAILRLVTDISEMVVNVPHNGTHKGKPPIGVLREREVLPRLELGLLDSESRVLTITP